MNARRLVAANAGYDPTPTGSKPVVLPLHQSAISERQRPTATLSCVRFLSMPLMFGSLSTHHVPQLWRACRRVAETRANSCGNQPFQRPHPPGLLRSFSYTLFSGSDTRRSQLRSELVCITVFRPMRVSAWLTDLSRRIQKSCPFGQLSMVVLYLFLYVISMARFLHHKLYKNKV